MIQIQLFKRGEGCEVPEDNQYLMATADSIDEHGQWLGKKSESFKTMRELKSTLREIVAMADSVVIKASGHFERIARELRLEHLASEWGRL